MATTRRRSAQPEEDGPRRPRQRAQSSNSILVPAAVLLGMIVGAILLARAIASKEDAGAQAQSAPVEEKKYFTSVPKEEPPTAAGRIGSSGTVYERAPTGLAASNPAWAEALTVAKTADALFEEAKAAKAIDDHATWQLKGKAAKETYDKAIILTAEWHEELLDKYGDRDPQVREIGRTRGLWIDRLRVLHKTTGR